MDRPTPLPASAYAHFIDITTRWNDNDPYGHINNVVYYEYFDTVTNAYLIDKGVLDINRGAVIGLMVETHCNYFRPIAFPEKVCAGMRVARLGTSSVRYEVGIFRNDEDLASAQGYVVHVYVDRVSGKPVPLPEALKKALAPLVR
jgi:acyl-CoA thioester hydrolase